MKYLTMFIKESLRLHPPVVAVGKRLDHPLTIKSNLNSPNENVIPSGSSVTSVHWLYTEALIFGTIQRFIKVFIYPS